MSDKPTCKNCGDFPVEESGYCYECELKCVPEKDAEIRVLRMAIEMACESLADFWEAKPIGCANFLAISLVKGKWIAEADADIIRRVFNERA